MTEAKQSDLSLRKVRSALTNGSAVLPLIDGRSVWARRFRDLVAAHINDLGGDAALSEGQRSMVRRTATLQIQCELQEQQFAMSEDGIATRDALETYQRVTNTLRRALESLGLHRGRVARDVAPTLAQYLATTAEGGST